MSLEACDDGGGAIGGRGPLPAGNAPDTAPIGNAACAGGGAAGGTGNAPAGIAPGWCVSDAQLGVLATRVEADSWMEAFYALRSAFAHETVAHSWRKVNIAAEAARLGGGSCGMRVGVGAQDRVVGGPEGAGLVGLGRCCMPEARPGPDNTLYTSEVGAQKNEEEEENPWGSYHPDYLV